MRQILSCGAPFGKATGSIFETAAKLASKFPALPVRHTLVRFVSTASLAEQLVRPRHQLCL
jgi:hypothetical protein